MAKNEDATTISDLEKQVDELTKTLNDAIESVRKGDLPPWLKGKGKNDDDDEEEVKKNAAKVTELIKAEADKAAAAAAEAQKQIDTVTAENAVLKAQAGMSEDEKVFTKDLDGPAKVAFMAKAETERRKEVDLKKSKDEVVVIEGQEMRKSVVGDAQFAVLKSLSDKAKKSADDLAKMAERAEMAELSKRADDLYGHVPGSVEDRAQMLRIIGAQDEPVRKAFEAVFTQSEKLAGTAFNKVGSKAVDGDDLDKRRRNGTEFEKKVDEIRKANKNLSRTEAMAKARVDHPKEFLAYQGQDSN